jgi:hypothetical protein
VSGLEIKVLDGDSKKQSIIAFRCKFSIGTKIGNHCVGFRLVQREPDVSEEPWP